MGYPVKREFQYRHIRRLYFGVNEDCVGRLIIIAGMYPVPTTGTILVNLMLLGESLMRQRYHLSSRNWERISPLTMFSTISPGIKVKLNWL